MQVNASIYGCIRPYIPIYALFWQPRDVQDLLPIHSHPGSWCVLHPADIATVQYHPTYL